MPPFGIQCFVELAAVAHTGQSVDVDEIVEHVVLQLELEVQPNPRHHHGLIERLGDEITAAGIQGGYLRCCVVMRGDEDHRGRLEG